MHLHAQNRKIIVPGNRTPYITLWASLSSLHVNWIKNSFVTECKSGLAQA